MTATHDAPSVLPRDLHRVLCVDNDAVSRRLLLAALTRDDRSIECACNGKQALDRFTNIHDPRGFDLLITDHAMPLVDGLQLLGRLRRMGFVGEAIVVTAGLSSEAATRYRELGVRCVLLKPVEVGRLRVVVTTALHAVDATGSVATAGASRAALAGSSLSS